MAVSVSSLPLDKDVLNGEVGIVTAALDFCERNADHPKLDSEINRATKDKGTLTVVDSHSRVLLQRMDFWRKMMMPAPARRRDPSPVSPEARLEGFKRCWAGLQVNTP